MVRGRYVRRTGGGGGRVRNDENTGGWNRADTNDPSAHAAYRSHANGSKYTGNMQRGAVRIGRFQGKEAERDYSGLVDDDCSEDDEIYDNYNVSHQTHRPQSSTAGSEDEDGDASSEEGSASESEGSQGNVFSSAPPRAKVFNLFAPSSPPAPALLEGNSKSATLGQSGGFNISCDDLPSDSESSADM